MKIRKVILYKNYFHILTKYKLAGKPGFEPRLPGPEPGVLPLNYFPNFIKDSIILVRFLD